MFEQNRRKNLYVSTLYVTGKIFVYYEIDKPYFGNVCLTQPAEASVWFPRLD